MPDFWKTPWTKSRTSLDDEQRVQLLPKQRNFEQLSATDACSQQQMGAGSQAAAVSPERYVGFGIGGAGNIRKVKTRGVEEIRVVS